MVLVIFSFLVLLFVYLRFLPLVARMPFLIKIITLNLWQLKKVTCSSTLANHYLPLYQVIQFSCFLFLTRSQLLSETRNVLSLQIHNVFTSLLWLDLEALNAAKPTKPVGSGDYGDWWLLLNHNLAVDRRLLRSSTSYHTRVHNTFLLSLSSIDDRVLTAASSGWLV